MSEKNEKNKSVSEREKNAEIEEEDLERLAVEALLDDVRRSKSRAEKLGPMGWVKERSVNKRFLNSLVLQTLPHRVTKRRQTSSETNDVDNSVIHRNEGGESQRRETEPFTKRRKMEEEEGESDKRQRKGDRDERDSKRRQYSERTQHNPRQRRRDNGDRSWLDERGGESIHEKIREHSHMDRYTRDHSKRTNRRDRFTSTSRMRHDDS